MSEYVPSESANVTIGVCGEQGSGKTVFLTCIFQSIWTAFPDDVVLDFDREEIGNADYFQGIEDLLLATGKPEVNQQRAGTRPEQLFPARIYVKAYEPQLAALPPVLSVDIKDFAGRHFRSLANLKDLGAPKDSDPDDVKVLRDVNETIKKADAFVILINSKEIDPLNDTPQRNPFSPSVNFLLAHCRVQKAPVALLFSQVDQTRMLTEEAFRTMPRVQTFERQFTSDFAEAAAGERPFGIVRRIACYATVEGDLAPIRQTLDGSIWKPEPAQVVLELLRAAMPRINARLREAAEAARRQKEQDELAAQRQKELDELRAKRRRQRRITAGIAALVAIVLFAGVSLLWQRLQNERRKLQLLTDIEARITQGQIASISTEAESSLSEILSAYRVNRSDTSTTIRTAIHNVHTAFGDAAQRLTAKPAFDLAYSDELARFQSLAPLLDPENTASWRATILPLLEERTAFLADWFARNRKGQERARVLNEAIQHFSAGDERFARVLAAQSNREKPPQVSVWRRRPPTATRTTTFIAWIAT